LDVDNATAAIQFPKILIPTQQEMLQISFSLPPTAFTALAPLGERVPEGRVHVRGSRLSVRGRNISKCVWVRGGDVNRKLSRPGYYDER